MQVFEEQFLFLLKASLNNEKLPDGYHFDINRVFSLAMIHNLLPVIYTKALDSDEDVSSYRTAVVRQCGRQISNNSNFEELFTRIVDNKINAIVVKGPVCASCYDVEYNRLSSDFDVVVKDTDRDKLHNFLLTEGFSLKGEAYINEMSGLYIEVSTRLGEGDDKYAVETDREFGDFFNSQVKCGVYNTLKPEMHLVYLLYHSFKHFIGSGFGLKQIADIYLFAKKYERVADFGVVYAMIEKIGIRSFSDNVFFLINRLFDYNFPMFSGEKAKNICFEIFLTDLLAAGVFGKSTQDRLHSAGVVHNTVIKKGKKTLTKTLFPDIIYMKTKFPVLNKIPVLLPLFWIVRFVQYVLSSFSSKSNKSVKNTLKIADSRIELMKKMGII